MAVVPVGQGVEQALPHRALVERGDLAPEQAVLVAVDLVAQVDQRPQRVQGQQEALAELLALAIGDVRFGAPVLERFWPRLRTAWRRDSQAGRWCV